MQGVLNNIIGRQHCVRVTCHVTRYSACHTFKFVFIFDGPLNTQGTYKIYDWTTLFARVVKNVRYVQSTGKTNASLKLSKTWERAVTVCLNMMPLCRGTVNIA